jgi:hypothetical protein
VTDQGWGPPPGPPRRFGTGAVVGGAVVGVVGTIALPVALGLLASVAGPVSFAFGLLAVVSVVVVLVLGIVLAATPGTPERRGFGLGLVIGWGLLLLVGGGLCIALIAGLSNA